MRRIILTIIVFLLLTASLHARTEESHMLPDFNELENYISRVPKESIGLPERLLKPGDAYMLIYVTANDLDIYILGSKNMASEEIANALDKAVENTPFGEKYVEYITEDGYDDSLPRVKIEIERKIPTVKPIEYELPLGNILAALKKHRISPYTALFISRKNEPAVKIECDKSSGSYYNITDIDEGRTVSITYNPPTDSLKKTMLLILAVPIIGLLGLAAGASQTANKQVPISKRRIRYHQWSTTPVLLAGFTLILITHFDSPEYVKYSQAWFDKELTFLAYYTLLAGVLISVSLSIILERPLLGPPKEYFRTELPAKLETILYGRIGKVGWAAGLLAAAFFSRLADISQGADKRFIFLLWMISILAFKEYSYFIFVRVLGLPVRRGFGKLPGSEKDKGRILHDRILMALLSGFLIAGLTTLCLLDPQNNYSTAVACILLLFLSFLGPFSLAALVTAILFRTVLKPQVEAFIETKFQKQLRIYSSLSGAFEKRIEVDPCDRKEYCSPILIAKDKIILNQFFTEFAEPAELDYLLTYFLCRDKHPPQESDRNYRIMIWTSILWFALYLTAAIVYKFWHGNILNWISVFLPIPPIIISVIVLSNRSIVRAHNAAVTALEYTKDYKSAVSALEKYNKFHAAQLNKAPYSPLIQNLESLQKRLKEKAELMKLPMPDEKNGEKDGES